MAERDLLTSALVREVLGPRGGANETLMPEEDPLGEYLTGVLAPREASSNEPDATADLLGQDNILADDQADPGGGVQGGRGDGAFLTPALDPDERASSLGLSFVVAAPSGRPLLDLCITWGRYERGEGGQWRRRPAGMVLTDVDASRERVLAMASDPGVALYLRRRQEGTATRWRVSIFLVNVTPCEGRRARTEDHVFQPQIRVRCHDQVNLVALDQATPAEDEEARGLSVLYRDRRSFARGHLCAAVWADVDPERPDPGGASVTDAPFHWSDGDALFEPDVVRRFSPPDARTEYVPVIPVNAPDMTWNADEAAPQLSPEELSEIWEPRDLRDALQPLATAYERWIERQRGTAQQLDELDRTAALRQLETCGTALARIRAGIDLLASNSDARLAFCFANRAIAMQSRWTREATITWRPFQLAFQLLNLPAIVDRTHPDRRTCDLLWFPTGGGKTEAYLGLAAFTMAWRRLSARRRGSAGTAGVTVLSRYTLRLLTIQQFRRALALLAACELLRIRATDGVRGWRPKACADRTDMLWDEVRFSAGLWVGGSVTPNLLQDFQYMNRNGQVVTVVGALSGLEGRGQAEGEPAQVLGCPACGATLALPPDGYRTGETQVLHLVIGDAPMSAPAREDLSTALFDVLEARLTRHADGRFATLSLTFTVQHDARAQAVDAWFRERVRPALGGAAWLAAARASRCGYFLRTVPWGRRRTERAVDFEIYCPNPNCEMNQDVGWWETTPSGSWDVVAPFRAESGRSTRCPIPAWTVDEQVYQRVPSMVIATVDKFARLSFEPKAAAIFGNVDRFNEHLGYYRTWCPPFGPSSPPTRPAENVSFGRNVSVGRLAAPDLILQDELHLIEGPLGSMVGIYESAVDVLASTLQTERLWPTKYIASTATVRRATEQVRSVFRRDLAVFPPAGVNIQDSFFARIPETHPLDADTPGRLYVGICAPGRGAQTPIRNIWARLLQHAFDRRQAGAPLGDLDSFWTLVGYFNALRELAGAVALVRQDIQQRLASLAAHPRAIDESETIELSSSADSLRLPGLLDQLRIGLTGAREPADLVVATSMFGTGVDVERLGLMVVHGQPKTTSAYIQATGRVGRARGGLIVTFLRASRPRDLNHYEFFTAYHTALYRHVEPVTVSPFAPRARDRALGPVAVALLRQASHLPDAQRVVPVDPRWKIQQRLSGPADWFTRAHEMSAARGDPDVAAIPNLLEERAQGQPGLRRPPAADVSVHAGSELDRWHQLASRSGGRLLYYEPTLISRPSRPVLLGDLAHLLAGLPVAYEDAPNSLREVEPTVTLRGWG